MLVAGFFERYDGSLLVVPPLILTEQIHDALHVVAFRRLATGAVLGGMLLGMAVLGVVSALFQDVSFVLFGAPWPLLAADHRVGGNHCTHEKQEEACYHLGLHLG
jgi:hypothetical protein